ncbi:MAG TPA: S41 family peptidase [Vicinamibacteria bacterium]|nr:S41 family peptidase [Vicinamibacteria bacterium]
MSRKLAALFVVLAGLGCGTESPLDSSDTEDCATLGQVQFVRTTLRDIYLWYRDLPDPAPSGFSSPEAYLEAVRNPTFDQSYSYVADQAESDAFFSESQFIGVGLGFRQTGASELRVTQVFPDSPAAEAGLFRGDYLLAVNGTAVATLLANNGLDAAFGPSTAGTAVTLAWRAPEGGEFTARLTKRAVTIPTVSQTAVYDLGRAGRVGYVHFRNFVRPSTAALNTAFAQLGEAAVDELILDLRYNGGGLISVARHLAGLIAGEPTRDQVFVEFFHNDKNTAQNQVLRFPVPADALGVSRLVVITTRASASASESIVNSLRPFMPVTVIGETTFGKPVGQYGFDFCDKTLFPVSFQVRNARGEGDYFEGIPADCAAADDLDQPLGDSREGSVAEALRYIRTGSCTTVAAAMARAQREREARIGRGLPRDGWRQLVNAY